MASSLAIKRIASKIIRSPPLAARTLLITPTAATTSRSSSMLFNNTCSNLTLGGRNYCSSSDSTIRTTFPFAVTKGLGPLMNPILQHEKFTGTHFVLYSTPTRGCGTTGEIIEDDKALYITVNMPGLAAEDVTVAFFDDKELVISGQQGIKKQFEEDPSKIEEVYVPRYVGSLALTPNSFKKEETQWGMKHGQLRVIVPRLKLEEYVVLVPVID